MTMPPAANNRIDAGKRVASRPLLLHDDRAAEEPSLAFCDGRLVGPLPAGTPLVVSYGMGVDSTAMLLGLRQEGVKPAAVLFADVGNEQPHTYRYVPVISAWLERAGFPLLTVVRYRPRRFKHHAYGTLAGNCLANRTLPSLAFGRKSCSLKWKGDPLDRKVSELFGDAPCYRAIGYDCSPADSRRFAHARKRGGSRVRPQDCFVYPLQLWGWTRADCLDVIAAAGLPLPGKSSCFFCPSMKAEEVHRLPPPLLRQIVIIEANAAPNLRTVAGLWRRERMTDFIVEEGLLPRAEVEALWARWSAAERVVTDREIVAEEILAAASAGNAL